MMVRDREYVLALDPGKDSGLALLENNTLVWCALCPQKVEAITGIMSSLGEYCALRSFGTTLVCEVPQIYQASRSKGNPNDLIPLAIQVGWCEALHQTLFSGPGERIRRTPRQWKGQTPKKVSNERILSKLSPTEREVLDRAAQGKKSKMHNVIDAVGIALHHVGRYR